MSDEVARASEVVTVRVRWSGRRQGLVALMMMLVVTGCATAGSATTRVDEAEEELAGIVERISQEIGFEPTSQEPFGRRSSCEQPGLGEGASSSASLRGPVPPIDDPVGRSAGILLQSGYELVDSDIGNGIFARRDGIRVTVIIDEPLGELAIDVATGCRPPPT